MFLKQATKWPVRGRCLACMYVLWQHLDAGRPLQQCGPCRIVPCLFNEFLFYPCRLCRILSLSKPTTNFGHNTQQPLICFPPQNLGALSGHHPSPQERRIHPLHQPLQATYPSANRPLTQSQPERWPTRTASRPESNLFSRPSVFFFFTPASALSDRYLPILY